MLDELKKKMREFQDGLPDGAKEQPSLEAFLPSLKDLLTQSWRDVWLARQQDLRKARTAAEAVKAAMDNGIHPDAILEAAENAKAEAAAPIPPVEPAKDEFRSLNES